MHIVTPGVTTIGLCERIGNQEQGGLVSGQFGMLLATIGDFEKAIVLGNKALVISEETGNLTRNAQANIYV